MQNGWLDTGDLEALARQAVDELSADIAIDFDKPLLMAQASWNTPEVVAWPVLPLVDGKRSFAVLVRDDLSPARALAMLVSGIGDKVFETDRFWDVAFPVCPGHDHRAAVAVDDDGGLVLLRCPDTGTVIRTMTPAASPRPPVERSRRGKPRRER